MTAGYSGRPLAARLGIRSGMRVAVLNAPDNYPALIGALPDGVTLIRRLDGPCDLIHHFAIWRNDLAADFPRLREALAQAGSLWVSWPKKASKAPTDLDENIIRDFGLAHGLVDVKVAAVDEIWSGLKFVRRLKDRR